MTIVAQYKDLRVHEWANGYAVEYIPTGEERWMSDGVDMFFTTGPRNVALKPGTALWNKGCLENLRCTYSEWLEAYFDFREEI